MNTQAAVSQYRQALSMRREELIELTQALIRIPTLNPPGHYYGDICDFLTERLRPRGFECQLLRAEGTPGDSEQFPRWNLMARHHGGGLRAENRSGFGELSNAECVHFNSHIDVVEVGAGWTVDPFGGDLINDRIYGRGSCDMKGGLAASIIACETFIDTFPEYCGAIEISATGDEESGGYGGVAWLAEQGWFDGARVQHVIIPEPLNKDRVCLGHRGVWWAEIETQGRIAHGSMPFLGDCAVRHMGAVINEMEATLFPDLKTRHTAMPVVPLEARQSTLNINSIHGGQAEPPEDFTGWPSAVVPDSCRMVIDRRFLIEEDLNSVKSDMRALLESVKSSRDGFRYTITDMHEVIPSMTARDAPVVTTVAGAIEQVLGKEPDYVVSPGTYDQKHIDRIGHMKNCIAYGPGILELAHQPDEYIGVQDMMDSAAVMGLSLLTLFDSSD